MLPSRLNLLLASTSTVHGASYLSYLETAVRAHFNGCKTVAFVPFARPGGLTWDDYTALPAAVFAAWGLELRGIHTWTSPEQAAGDADGFFVGGGNTFVLLDTLQRGGWMAPIDEAVRSGKPYMGSSAGTNMAGRTIGTTNDMPIAHPANLNAFEWLPFNLNPHYLDADPHSTHKGETREQRIGEFHCYHNQPVLGLREGSWLHVTNGHVTLEGSLNARLFQAGQPAVELNPGTIRVGE